MAKHEGYFFWGVLLGAAAAAIAGALALARSFKRLPAASAPAPGAARGRIQPAPGRMKAGSKRPARRPAARKKS